MQESRPVGMLPFTMVCAGQAVSLLGTAITRFAITIWAWQITGQATALALVGFFSFVPSLLLSPIAGALVDRWNRKLVMMLSDVGAGVSTVVVLLLYVAGDLKIWHLYVTGAFAGVFESFQFPAYSAAVTMMVPTEQYARASGMLSLAGSASDIMAPALAGVLLGIFGIAGILTFDIITFLMAIGVLLFVRIPQPATARSEREGQDNIWKESVYGFRYIFQHLSLLGLLLMLFVDNLIADCSFVVIVPMILARTGGSEVVMGSVQSALGLGGAIGGLLLSVWGGPKRRMQGVFGGLACTCLLSCLLGLGRSVYVWAFAAFSSEFCIPIVYGSEQAIWQTKVAPDVQGRVFAARRLIVMISRPVALLVAGPMADHIFEPAMMPGGKLATTFGWSVGTGPGAGMALMFVVFGVLGALNILGWYAVRAVRAVEDILPDHDMQAAFLGHGTA